MTERIDRRTSGPASFRGSRRWWLFSGVSLFSIAVLALVVEVVIHRAGPILKGRVVETLKARFDSHVELDDLHVSIGKGLEVSGNGLRIFPREAVVAAGATQPLISVGHFSFHAGLMGLFVKPMHVGTVYVSDTTIRIPPREMREQAAPRTKKEAAKIKIDVDEIVFEHSWLILGTMKPNRDPKVFELLHIVMRNPGEQRPWNYDATLVNAIPKGNIHAVGTFGSWRNESPSETPLTGRYTFDHADLSTIRGIGGMLSSVGEFAGRLNRIVVDGTTQTPDFSLDMADHPMPLETKFHAIVDGTTGDTYLQPVHARLGGSEFACSGAIVNIKGVGHTIDLDVDVPNGKMEDFLRLAVKRLPVLMTGWLKMKTKLHIRPGKESVSKKMTLDGSFALRQIHFTNPGVEDKVDMLSLRAQGDAKDAKPGAEDVTSRMAGRFVMSDGTLSFSRLDYLVPGADVTLAGDYSLSGERFEFRGTVRTQATVSQMVASRWKSLLLRPVDRYFKKDGVGAEIPIKVSGVKSAFKIGLDFGQKNRD